MSHHADHPSTHFLPHPLAHPLAQPWPGLLEKEPPLLDLIRQQQAQHGFFPPVGPDKPSVFPLPVIVGVSGGGDSLCLLHLLVRLTAEFALTLHVAHLDHGLRPDSASDATFVADVAAAWGLPFHHKRLPPGHLTAQGGSLEAAARTARFTFLLDLAASLVQEPTAQEPIIALAHHADDQAETLLLHLLRGSGLDGLAAMRPVSRRPLPGMPGASIQYARIVRPLLDADRTQIMRYLSVHALAWREDATNQDTAFTRNRLRHQILPLLREINPNLTATLGRTAHILAGEADRLARLNRETLADLLLSPAHPARLVLDRDKLAALDEADQRGVLRLALGWLLAGDWVDPEVRLFSKVELLSRPPAADDAQIGYNHVAALAATLAEPAVAGGPFPIVAGLAWSVAPSPPSTNPPTNPRSSQVTDLAGLPQNSLKAPAGSRTRLEHQEPHDRLHRYAPTRLSLHRADRLPFPPDHPWLAEEADPRPIPVPGDMAIQGWQLHARICAPADLPTDWATLSPWEAYLDLDCLGAPALVCPKTGLDFPPLGMGGQRKSLGDLFTDCKIPLSLRAGWPLILAESGQVAWVCGVQMGHDCRITPQTEHIVHLNWQPT